MEVLYCFIGALVLFLAGAWDIVAGIVSLFDCEILIKIIVHI